MCSLLHLLVHFGDSLLAAHGCPVRAPRLGVDVCHRDFFHPGYVSPPVGVPLERADSLTHSPAPAVTHKGGAGPAPPVSPGASRCQEKRQPRPSRIRPGRTPKHSPTPRSPHYAP